MTERPTKHSLFTKALMIWGIVQGYNIFAQGQSIIDLSNSIHFFMEWWNYLISIPFEFIPIDLSQDQRNFLVLTGLLFSAVNLASKKDVGINMFDMWRDITFHGGSKSSKIVQSTVKNAEIEIYIVTLILIIITSAFVVYDAIIGGWGDNYGKVWIGIYLIMGLSLLMRDFADEKMIRKRSELYRGSRIKPLVAASSFVTTILFGYFPFGIVYYRARLAKSVLAILLLFVLDAAFSLILDPYLPLLGDLPLPQEAFE